MQDIDAFILAGGASRRMGTDKSQLPLDGQTLIQRVAAALERVAGSVTVVGRSAGAPHLQSIEDVYPQWGALGGVHAALANCKTEWAIVVACDMPYVTEELFARLASWRATFEAVAVIQADGRPQPLCSLYRVIPCKEAAEKLIRSGERKPVILLQSVRTRWVDFAELKDLEGADRFFVNMNTLEEYSQAQSKGAGLKED